MRNRNLLGILARSCRAGFLAFGLSITSHASTVYVDLNGDGTNESNVTLSALVGSPVSFSSKVTSKAVGAVFAFDWTSAGPGGFTGSLPLGTSAGVGVKWIWETTSRVSAFTGSNCEDDVCFALGDSRTEPVLGPFFAPGRTTSRGSVSLSSATLTTVLLKAFSPFVTLASATSSVELLRSGEFRYKTFVSNLTNADIETETELLPLRYTDALGSAQGPEWDTLSIPLTIPAGRTSMTVQVLSRDDLATGDRPASLAWVGAALAIAPYQTAAAQAFALRVDSTETLGPASVPISLGTGMAAGGVGLTVAQPGTLTVTVPGGAAVKQVLLFWEGASVYPAPGDDTIVVNGRLITGTLIGGPTVFFEQGGPGGPGVQVSAFRADISSLGLVHSGLNSLAVEGLDYGFANDGAGILVIYDDGTAKAEIQVREGLDLAYLQFAPPLDTTVPQTYTFAPSTDDRTANLVLFLGSVQGSISVAGPHRPNSIQVTFDSTTPPPAHVIMPGGTYTNCTTSSHPAMEIANRLDLCGDGIPGPPGSCLGALHPAAHGTFNLLRPDLSKTVGNALLTPYRVTVTDPPPGGNGDGLLEPGETAGLTIEVLNAGPMSVLTAGSANAVLTSPPADLTIDGTTNPIPVSLSVDSSPYPDFVGFVPTEPPGAPCLLAAPAPLTPSANVRPFMIFIPQNHPRDVSRPFFVKIMGHLPNSTPVTMTVPLNIGIGSGCNPAAVPGTCDDGNLVTVDTCVACTDKCNVLGGLCVSAPPGSAPCTGTIGDFIWNDANQDGVQNPGEPGIPNVKVLLKQPGTFGGVSPGSLSSRAGEGYKFGSIFPLLQAGTATKFLFYAAGGGADQKFTPVIYSSDVLGNPLNLVAKGVEVTVSGAQSAGWVESALPPVPLAPGNYLLGLLSGPASAGGLNFYDSVPDAGVYNANLYPTPSSAWGAINREDRRWSFQVAYAPSGGGITRATTTTSADGSYYFSDLCAGSYSVVVDGTTIPAGFVASPCNVGNDSLDSDCSPVDVNFPSDSSTNLTTDLGYHSPSGACTGKIGDFVWNDINGDGVQNGGEPGIFGVKVTLQSSGGTPAVVTMTSASGNYQFSGLCAGSYTVTIDPTTVPSGLVPSLCNASDDALDNDCSPATVTLSSNISTDLSIDFGYHSGSCQHDADCEDDDICTTDTCLAGVCRHLIPPGSTCLCTPASACASIGHAGTLSTTVDLNGDITVLFNQATGINDNSYGTNIVNWPRSHNFSDLVGSDKGQFVFKDANGNVVFDFTVDYLSAKTGTPSGYASLGVTGGDGRVTLGQASWLLAWQTSEAANLNATGYCTAGNCTVSGVNLLVNSPPTNPPNTSYNLPPAFNQWDFNITYMVKVSHLAFGSSSFGSASFPFAHNSPPKCGSNSSTLEPCQCSGTIGNFVWNDLDQDGLQDAGEPGLSGVTVVLRNSANAIVATTTTSASGFYQFTGVCAGSYTVAVDATTLPPSFVPSPCNAVDDDDDDDAVDNVCSPAAVTLTNNGTTNLTIDFGYHDQSPPPCTSGETHIGSNFNGTSIDANKYIWFNAVVKVSGDSCGGTVDFSSSTVTVRAAPNPLTLAVPSSKIVFSPAATVATAVRDPVTGSWVVTVPCRYKGDIFLSGFGYKVLSKIAGGASPVTWQGTFTSNRPDIEVEWKWAAAVYSTFSLDNGALGAKSVEGAASGYRNSDHAGTPENFKQFVIGGARGGGGSNYTGSYSGKEHAEACFHDSFSGSGD